MSILIQAPELMSSTGRVVLLDVRWKLGGPPGREDYLAGHLPGAVFVGLDTELAAHGEPQDGRHPLPSIESLQDAARRWGIRSGDTVVAYDDNGNLAAARAWWLLRWAGFDDVRLLDGGLAAWVAAGGDLDTDDVVPEPGDVTLDAGHVPTIDIDGAAEFPGVLLDARAAERYAGETEPIDPRAGHIPGAVSAPTTDNLDDDGRFLPVAELRRHFEALGVRDGVDVATYCGSGVTAAHEVAALAIAGFDAALYPGSWSQWSNHDDRPVATGTTQ
ncbi:sulfurtransferase [Aeromicrobium sp. 9AM]|uniref:sulfurtransferase n=1 Tax=Aeromicrobium sp. 9AM TaxID=2653126 RepID=UPI0012F37ABC|nr:sulfurtransferase [Aeromicrobium sp. 9AM]VXB50837.1 putative thiosulfate sulfurtransferase SseB [Aeromicrobium sp. 9AM]